MQKPILLDSIVDDSNYTQTEIDGRWYIAKSISYWDVKCQIRRIYHAWLVLCGRANAFQYAEDQIKRDKS
jgi:hypothetical protein